MLTLIVGKLMNMALGRNLYKRFLLMTFCLLGCMFLYARPVANESQKILVVTSYNPDNQSISPHLSSFIEYYAIMGGRNYVVVETINSQNLSEIYTWQERLRTVLAKHMDHNEKPAMVVLVGQEVWASYLSMKDDWVKSIPVMGVQVSANAVDLPSDSIPLNLWKPMSTNAFTDYPEHNIVGCIANHYDLDKNIELIRRYYPNTRSIAFLSDNSFPGVTMQALIKREILKYPDLKLILLDGKMKSFTSICDDIRSLPPNTCILLGYWKVDRTDNYYVGNTTYMFRDANPAIPAFTMSTIGLGHWAIGGYIPDYHNIGSELAEMVYRYLDGNYRDEKQIKYLDSRYRLDVKKLKEFGLSEFGRPDNTMLVNETPSFYEANRKVFLIILGIMVVLSLGIMGVSYYAFRIRRLRDDLITSQRQLMIARDKAEEANRLKSSFLANMSHEIRTPLNAIVGFSDVLVSGEFPEDEKMGYCEIIKKNSDILLVLINDILDISRIESGHLKMVYQNYDVVNVARESLMVVEQTKRTPASFILDSELEAYVVRTDAQRLKQVFMNLLTNAAKFTREGSIRISIEMNKEQDMLQFAVTDTGCGIPEDKAETIFERFEKLDEYVQGTGLGLSITRLIVEKLGGKIWVDTSYKAGARFVFTHPL